MFAYILSPRSSFFFVTTHRARLLATHIPKKKDAKRKISFAYAALKRCSAQDVAFETITSREKNRVDPSAFYVELDSVMTQELRVTTEHSPYTTHQSSYVLLEITSRCGPSLP